MGSVEVGLATSDATVIPNAARQVIADAAGRFLFREIGSCSYTMRAAAASMKITIGEGEKKVQDIRIAGGK